MSLSAGQIHRLTLARAFLREGGILLLDEPFANVDGAIEKRLWENLSTFRGRRTVVIVTHRDPPLGATDCIIALEGGRVREICDATRSMSV